MTTNLGSIKSRASDSHIGSFDEVDPSDSMEVLLLLRRTEGERDVAFGFRADLKQTKEREMQSQHIRSWSKIRTWPGRRTNLLEISSTDVGRDGLDEDLMRSGSRSDESLPRVVDDLAVLDDVQSLVQGIFLLLVCERRRNGAEERKETRSQLELTSIPSSIRDLLKTTTAKEGFGSPSPQLSSPNAKAPSSSNSFKKACSLPFLATFLTLSLSATNSCLGEYFSTNHCEDLW